MLKINKDCFGGWLNSLFDTLVQSEDINLAIATTYNGKELQKFQDEKVTYYMIPGGATFSYNKKQEEYWKRVDKEFFPDLIHIHGTEFAHGLAFLNACPDRKAIVSIQGLVHKMQEVYYGNIPIKEIIKNVTFRDIIKRDSIFQQKRKFEIRGKSEIEMIKRSDAVIGRTMWDYANTKYINPNEKYYIGNETLRKIFYNYEWNIEEIEKHTLFCSQASYTIKGFHYLLEAINILKKQYKDIKVYVAGPNIIGSSTLKLRLKMNGYAKYIVSIIKKYNLEEQIIFTGILNEEQITKRLLKTHVFVLPSVIENSSNSLGEAMMLGMPCVATNTGGTMDILEHNKEGYLYPYTEPAICAEYISRIFENNKLACEIGKEARKIAQKRHNEEENSKQIIKIYKEIIGEKCDE